MLPRLFQTVFGVFICRGFVNKQRCSREPRESVLLSYQDHSRGKQLIIAVGPARWQAYEFILRMAPRYLEFV